MKINDYNEEGGNNRIISADRAGSEEEQFDNALRPLSFSDFIGQEAIKENLRIFVEAAKRRGEALDHVLFCGPPGLGKTTLSRILANELGVSIQTTSGPVLEKKGDLAGSLTNLTEREILFIDEIHRLNRVVEESLYPAMEDFVFDITIGDGPAARSIRLNLKPFTLVGATTRAGMLTSPMHARFGYVCRLAYYTPEELSQVIARSASILGVIIVNFHYLSIIKKSKDLKSKDLNSFLDERRYAPFIDKSGG